MILRVMGHVPSKKNTWRPKASGVYQRSEVKAEINGIILQLKGQWKASALEETAFLKMVFTVPNGKSDLDNKATCMIDCLVKAGVVKNDSIARINEFHALAYINSLEEEWTEIQIY